MTVVSVSRPQRPLRQRLWLGFGIVLLTVAARKRREFVMLGSRGYLALGGAFLVAAILFFSAERRANRCASRRRFLYDS